MSDGNTEVCGGAPEVSWAPGCDRIPHQQGGHLQGPPPAHHTPGQTPVPHHGAPLLFSFPLITGLLIVFLPFIFFLHTSFFIFFFFMSFSSFAWRLYYLYRILAVVTALLLLTLLTLHSRLKEVPLYRLYLAAHLIIPLPGLSRVWCCTRPIKIPTQGNRLSPSFQCIT